MRNLFTALGIIALLTACFLSDEQLVTEAEAIHPPGLTHLCSEDGCVPVIRDGIDYIVDGAIEEPSEKVRFTSLQADTVGTYFLAGHGRTAEGFMYGVARASENGHYDYRLLPCDPMTDAELTQFEIEREEHNTCRVTSLDQLQGVLALNGVEFLDDEAFWSEDEID